MQVMQQAMRQSGICVVTSGLGGGGFSGPGPCQAQYLIHLSGLDFKSLTDATQELLGIFRKRFAGPKYKKPQELNVKRKRLHHESAWNEVKRGDWMDD